MKTILFLTILTQLALPQNKSLLLLFDSERTQAETITDGLISYWNLDESGTSGLRADLIGTNTLRDSNTVPSESTIKKLGNSAETTTANSEQLYVLDNTSIVLGTGFTLTAWVNMITISPLMDYMAKWRNSTNQREFILERNGTSMACYFSTDGINVATILTSDITYTINTWYFVTIRYDAAKDSCYLQVNNGTVQQAALSSIYNSTEALRFGASGNTGFAQAYFDEIGLWNRPLTPAELSYLYNSGAGRTYTTGKIE